MLKALKVILIVFGAIYAVVGVLQAFFPSMFVATSNLGELYAAMATSGVSLIAGGIFLIIAGTRDILRNVLWVQFGLLWSILGVAIATFSVLMGYLPFSLAMGSIIIDGLFFILLMVFYPWGRTEG